MGELRGKVLISWWGQGWVLPWHGGLLSGSAWALSGGGTRAKGI